VDITGPHPQITRGSKYILTGVDAFSKWAEAFAIPNREAKTVARDLVEQVFCHLGTPVALLTDSAGELDGHLMQEICRLLEIDKQHTSFYSARNARIASAVLATAIPSVRLSVCLSVCLSVTRRYCVKMTARSTVQFSPLDSKMCLVL